MSETWKAEWQTFFEALQDRNRRLLNEMTGAWSDTSALLRLVGEAFGAWQSRTWRVESFEATSDKVRQAGRDLLEAPLDQYQRRRPVRRALSAIEECDSSIEELVRTIPGSLPCSGRKFLAWVEMPHNGTWVDSVIGWRRLGRTLPLRRVIVDYHRREAWLRSWLDDSFRLLLTRACLKVREPWHTYRTHVLRSFAGLESETQPMTEEWSQWQQRTEEMAREATQHLERYRNWVDSTPSRLAGAIQRGSWHSDSGRSWSGKYYENRCQRNLSLWLKEQRALATLLDAELQMRQLGRETTQITAKSVISLRQEHSDLSRMLAGMLNQLRAWSDFSQEFEPALPDTRLLGLEERVDRWSEEVLAAGQALLPERLETPNPRRWLFVLQGASRSVDLRRVFSQAVKNFGQPIFRAGLAQVTEANLLTAREMEHARGVVEYGLECAKLQPGLEKNLLAEAVANARGLLEERLRAAADLDSLDRRGVAALVAVFQETYTTLEVSLVGQLAHMTRLKGRRALSESMAYTSRGVQTGSQRLWDLAGRSFDRLLLRIGWRLPARPALEPVIQRADLTHVMEVKLARRQLPSIYQHLFRLDPVQDPRFLVARDEELQAFARTLQQWESGQFAAILLVGDRGSGKTSLLNCARSSVFAGRNVVAANFSQRVTSPEQMQTFLRELFQIPEPANLLSTLATGQRIVILEEFERTFLRTVNGFDSIRYLLQLIHPTASSTLWILVLNNRCFRYLDAAVDVSRFFSHRINAMAVSPEDLEKAILQRHNLSGLRLKFAPPRPEDPRVGRLRNWLGVQRDAKQLFFDALYAQSGGVFRSAFELWQGCIENVEDGVIELRQPLAPDYRSLRNELVQMDHFTLVAVLQHGSLTGLEVAQVFCEDVETSRSRLERLQALAILEPDPLHPGMRVRPEARHFVLDTLHRVNLV